MCVSGHVRQSGDTISKVEKSKSIIYLGRKEPKIKSSSTHIRGRKDCSSNPPLYEIHLYICVCMYMYRRTSPDLSSVCDAVFSLSALLHHHLFRTITTTQSSQLVSSLHVPFVGTCCFCFSPSPPPPSIAGGELVTITLTRVPSRVGCCPPRKYKIKNNGQIKK